MSKITTAELLKALDNIMHNLRYIVSGDYIEKTCAFAYDEITRQNHRIAELERELAAAKEDIRSMQTGKQTFPPKPCRICKRVKCSCSSGGSACKGFVWRGIGGCENG